MGGVNVTVVLTEPVPLPGGFSVPNVGSAAVRVMSAPDTPDAWTGTDANPPPATVTSAIGSIASVGALPTRTWVTLVPESAFAAVNWRSYSPVSAALGVQANVPDVFAPLAANDEPAGRPDAVNDVMALPSG